MTNKINNLPSSSLSFYTIKELVEDTEKLGKHLVRDVKTTQIRKFLDAANRLRFHPDRKTNFTTAIKGELQLLRPKLAYAVGRQSEKNKGIKDLQTVIECAIKKVNTPDDFIRFLQLIESIVAYHKFAGGKDQ
jgi:CRISPR-associated protein Csm2